MSATKSEIQQQLPLCVDLDGTLTLTDTLWESCVKLLRLNPLYILNMLLWLFSGKAKFKLEISKRVQPDAELLPYTPGLLTFLKEQKQLGRHLCLVTAASREIADKVEATLGLFDRVIASDDKTNLSGKKKAARLVEIYGEKGFAYAGNGSIDLDVWAHAATAIPVNASAGVVRRLHGRDIKIEAEFKDKKNSLLKALIKAVRPHQWAKNCLLFVPITLSHNQIPADWLTVCLAFVAFSMTASAIYLINDLFDVETDRKHSTKCKRPFASAILPIPTGIAAVVVLVSAAAVLAYAINKSFFILLMGYVCLTTAYSIVLKMHALLDVFTLTILYTLRIIGGALAIEIDISNWLLAFSIFFFLSMAFAKRYSELHNLAETGDLAAGTRGYVVRDLMIVILFGVTSGYLAVMVFILYIQDIQVTLLYSKPRWLWVISFVQLYWISRVWLHSYRGRMNEDPVLFALHDVKSYIMAAMVGICFLLAI